MVDASRLANGGIVDPAKALSFFQRYPVTQINRPHVLPAAIKPIVVQPPPNTVRPATLRPAGEDDLNVIPSGSRIKYMSVATWADPRSNIRVAGRHRPASLTIDANAGAGRLPVYWLPYDLNHHRRLTLVDKQAIGNVRLFLTDMIDGCSIYVEGTPQEPTVSHLNANKVLPIGVAALPNAVDQSLAAQNLRNQAWGLKWGSMDARFQNSPKPKRVANVDPNLSPSRKLESQHYMFASEDARVQFSGRLTALQGTQDLPTVWNGQPVNAMEALFAQGTAFGILSGGIWHFYVQRRVLLQLFNVQHQVHAVSNLRSFKTNVLRQAAPIGPSPGGVTVTMTSLGYVWLIRSVEEFWPGVAIGAVA